MLHLEWEDCHLESLLLNVCIRSLYLTLLSDNFFRYFQTEEQTPIYYSNILWHTINNLPGINIFPSYESAAFPNFKIFIQLQAFYLVSFAGGMQCSLSMEVPKGGNAVFYSDPWELYKKSAAESECMSTMLAVTVLLWYLVL